MEKNMEQQILIKKTIEILVGIPCSGKSTYAYSEYIAGMNGVYEISRDSLRDFHFNKPYIYSKFNEDKITKLFSRRVEMYLDTPDCTTLILDNTHCKEKYIDEIIKKYHNYNIKIKFFDISLCKAHYRNIVRYIKTSKWIPLKVMNQMYKNYNKINKLKYEKYILY